MENLASSGRIRWLLYASQAALTEPFESGKIPFSGKLSKEDWMILWLFSCSSGHDLCKSSRDEVAAPVLLHRVAG